MFSDVQDLIRRYQNVPVGDIIDAISTGTVTDLEKALASAPEIGPSDYADEGMLQYLRTERVIPPYQTKGYKLVELVRVYEAGTPRRD